jgi:C_GCAxxG_C_C family probable redox protein
MAESITDKAYQLGFDYEQKCMGCSQCVLAALQDAFRCRNDDIFKAAAGLAGGGGTAIDGSCGAYSGATMFISSVEGRERANFSSPPDANLRTFELVKELHDRFIQEYGSVICRNIQTKLFGRPFYLIDPDEFEKFEKAGAHDIHCPGVVGKAARWTAEILIEANLAPKSS